MAFVKPGSATMNGESLWSRLAGLALIVEGCEYDRLHAMFAYEFERVTTQLRLVGAGTDGLGEDVSVFPRTAPRCTRLGPRCRSRASGH